ncbi:hypothetical protein [Chitinimonas sp. BJB300]|uniref:hypothetical protein n=1 Tax=Chitinimonas sp. BJB300 TaxID=1559339 RepID=UPI000C11D93F|nr:hypothetical protein [Chitinimonas sp. BJB300]PHV11183.1 hypothetical protein CSQ89_12315 [Chitinimonas sp. BJB300]TSJ87415.1 hypothetical protein FG002_014400 [Chitinimonas sp. BJB300]
MLIALTSRDSGDVISASLSRLSEGNANIATLDMADVVEKAYLELGEDGCCNLNFNDTNWQQPMLNAKVCLNRALINAKTLTQSKENTRILQTELEDVLRSHINNIPQASAKAGMYGLCGDYLPLYLQWQRVQAIVPACLVPKYQYAFGSVAPEIDDFKAPIYKSVFDFRTWKPNTPPQSLWHTFVVDRPAGQPLVAVIVGEKVFFSTALESELQQRLEAYSIFIAQAFGSEFGEILYFIDGDSVCFAAHSHVIRLDIPSQSLDDAVATVVRKYLD